MDYHNMFAGKQLLDVAKELHSEIDKLPISGTDYENLDEYDQEYRWAVRRGIQLAIDKIYERIETLQNERGE